MNMNLSPELQAKLRRVAAGFRVVVLCGTLSSPAAFAQAPASATEIILNSFGSTEYGNQPRGGIARDGQGNLYGTTYTGGTGGAGLVYKLSAGGELTILHAFSGKPDGSNPEAGPTLDANSNLYGTTLNGGLYNLGSIYRVDAAGNETVIYSFPGGFNGSSPSSEVIVDAQGNLYGTTPSGGTARLGMVYRLDPAGDQTVLYSFTGAPDGEDPVGPVTRDANGNLYGTTVSGGTGDAGVVFELNDSGQETLLYSFPGSPFLRGKEPLGGLVRDASGILYGTASGGGTAGDGVVFKLDPSGDAVVLHSFTGVNGDGKTPTGALARDARGNLYGATVFGGAAGMGSVFELDPAGQETILDSFSDSVQGTDPSSGLILDPAGNLYGVTSAGGMGGGGTIYEVNRRGKETLLFSFLQDIGGDMPDSTLTLDAAGALYGTTAYGGAPNGSGVVYKLDANGQETVLHTFADESEGQTPTGNLVRIGETTYGITAYGGLSNQSGYGVVFKLDPSGQETVLHTFASGEDGQTPSALIADAQGDLYGTTLFGGAYGGGVLFKIDTSENYSVIYSFAASQESPNALVLDQSGNLYGTTYGIATLTGPFGGAFKLDPSGNYTQLYVFQGKDDGSHPSGGVVLDPAGNLYGTTVAGGSLGGGTVFRVDATGLKTVLYNFGQQPRIGYNPVGIVRDAAGNFYGTTLRGTSDNAGAAYKLDPSGHVTLFHSFSGGADGFRPNGALTLDSDGNLFGTTSSGGIGGDGVVFKLIPE